MQVELVLFHITLCRVSSLIRRILLADTEGVLLPASGPVSLSFPFRLPALDNVDLKLLFRDSIGDNAVSESMLSFLAVSSIFRELSDTPLLLLLMTGLSLRATSFTANGLIERERGMPSSLAGM